MAEEAKEVKEAPKKKGKMLPIIFAIVLVVAAGGFFMMKPKSKAKPKVEIKLGEIQTMPEFLVNLKDGNAYVRAEIAMQTKEGFDKEKFDKVLPVVRDAVLMQLSSKSLAEIETATGKQKLKKLIATAVNKAINASVEDKDKEDSSDKSDTKDKKKDSEKDKESSKDKEKDKPEDEHPDWDSQTGPVLKVFFTNFATQ